MNFSQLFRLLIESAETAKPKRKMNAAAALHKWFLLNSQGKLSPEKKEQLEKIIATSAPTSVAHAIKHLGTRFDIGEKAILRSSVKNVLRYGRFLLRRVFKVDPKTLPNLQTMNDEQEASFYKALIAAETMTEVQNIIQTTRI